MIVFVWSLVPKKKKVLLCNLCYLPLDFCFFQRENGWGELRAKCADKLLWWFHFNCLWSIAAPFYMLFFLPLFIFLDSVFFASLFCFPKFEGAQFGCDCWDHAYVKVSEAYICTLLLWSWLLLYHTCEVHAICKFQSSDYDCLFEIF